MKRYALSLVLLGLFPFSVAAQETGCARFVEDGGKLTEKANGLTFAEGPAWHPDGYFIFSDVPGNVIYKITPDGAQPYRSPSAYANGNTFAPDGTLYTARHDRRVVMTKPGGEPVEIAASFEGKKLNSPNDIVLANDGAVWFTDPDYGLTGYGPEKAPPEQPVMGVYRVKDGKITRTVSTIGKPNGLAFTRDGSALIVSDSSTSNLYKVAIAADGSVAEPQKWATLSVPAGHTPFGDGLKIDVEGNVWAASVGAVEIIDPKAKSVCRLVLDSPHVSNIAFGGRDGKDVLITASDKVYGLRSKIAGN